ncbi:RNA polymerase sigma factor [Pedobacter deserti]|uniref:RNA polymerase sigma factor n=1 Tax=Pedobacter deserti TaxID=2817382 RepID=UPI0021089665|nr:RNA polymerase sigma-70 factor [Pedobacter sp. SYSU D00382]
MQGTEFEDFNEKALLTRLKAGDKQAFESLYHRYKHRIAGNLLRLLKSEELAEEILQDMFVRLWDRRSSIDPEQSFRSYLFRVAENKVMDYYRRMARDKKMREKLTAAVSELYSHIEEDIFSKENSRMLQEAIDQLPPQRKQVFILCKMEGKSYKEVAELLSISPSTINDHLYKANLFLKAYFRSDSGMAKLVLLSAMFTGIS